MNRIYTLLTCLMLALSINSYGQDETPFIEVVGTAEKEVVPDEIFITITIRDRLEGKEKITIEKQESDLKEALQSIDVSLDNLSFSDANANYIKVKWLTKDVIAKSEYVLKVGDALTVGKVFEKLDELKIVDANISRVSHSKLEELKKEVQVMAIKAAKEKADYLLQAINEETGKAIIVREQSPFTGDGGDNISIRGARSASAVYYIDGMKMRSPEQDQDIQFEKIKLQAAVYVKFGIK